MALVSPQAILREGLSTTTHLMVTYSRHLSIKVTPVGVTPVEVRSCNDTWSDKEGDVMARPLRLEFPGAVYHLTSRGNARQRIFFNDRDRELFLQTLSQVISRYSWICHAYCVMANHYHLLIETPKANTVGSGLAMQYPTYTRERDNLSDI